jgi:hypothetical protein
MCRTERPQIFSVSDSHTTTAYVMSWLSEHRVPLRQLGVLSFDHHTDILPVRGAVKKESVMTHLLQESGVGRVAVVGFDDRFVRSKTHPAVANRFDAVSGAELYSSHGPDKHLFDQTMEHIFDDWQAGGITTLYTSVDLDGLRLPDQLYTATDYNPIDNIRGLLDLPQPSPVRDQLATPVDTLSVRQADEAVRWLKNFLRARQLTDYHGIPASWVTRAMHLAHDRFGLQLGVTRPGTEQRLVGDIVEYTLPDYQQRTAKITRALLGSMAKVATV